MNRKGLEAKLWKLAREITIRRHGNTCYTCGKSGLVGRHLHCGHYISRRRGSTELKYHLDNLRPQCPGCNMFGGGATDAYAAQLTRDGISITALDDLNRSTKGLKYPRSWFEDKLEEYKKVLDDLSSVK